MGKAELAERCRAGDSEALDALYRHYLPQMRKVVARYVRNPDAAQDVVHDGFCAAFSAIGTLKDSTRLDAWLATIMRNTALLYLRKMAAEPNVAIDESVMEQEVADESETRTELSREDLDAIIARLPEGYGRVFRLSVFEGLSHKEIGSLLGIAAHSSSSQLAHAKAMLRRMISEYRIALGLVSVAGIVALVWHSRPKLYSPEPRSLGIGRQKSGNPPVLPVAGSVRGGAHSPQSALVAPQLDSGDTVSVRTEGAVAHACPDTLPAQQADAERADTSQAIPHLVPGAAGSNWEVPPLLAVREPSGWSVSLAFSGNPGSSSDRLVPGNADPDLPSDQPAPQVAERTHRHVPLTVGLTFGKSLPHGWGLETGVRYTLLRSDIVREGADFTHQATRKAHYLGIPLKFSRRLFDAGRFSLYIQGGGALDIPIHSTSRFTEWSSGTGRPVSGYEHFRAPLQWSVEGGLGVQYRFSPSVSLYAEPSLHYFFAPRSGSSAIRGERPFEFSFPLGLRFSW